MSTSPEDLNRRVFLRTGLTGALGTALLPLASCDAFDPAPDSQTPVGGGPEGAPSDDGPASPSDESASGAEFRQGCIGGKDCIPALTDPETSPVSEVSFLAPRDRIIAVRLGETWFGVPHRILWWHEIVNFSRGTEPVAVTLCPLTGSSLTFRRTVIDGAEFGVSGLLFKNNLVLYDRRENDSLWPQMMRRAARGPARGTELSLFPSLVMDWARFRELHPRGQVVNRRTGYDRDYGRNPYGESYYDIHSDEMLFPLPNPIDDRRRPKESVLGIPEGGSGGTAFPFGELESERGVRVVDHTQAGTRMVVFWDGKARAAMAYHPELDGDTLRFEIHDGSIVDAETESEWSVAGEAVAGPRKGMRLPFVDRAYVAWWYAWASFQPETGLHFCVSDCPDRAV